MLEFIRMLAMGAHFALAGAVGLAVCLARPFDPDNSRRVARIYASASRWILGFSIRVDMSAAPASIGQVVYVCNHQSNFDLFVVGKAVPARTVTVGKLSLRWVPLFGQIFWLSGNVMIDRGDSAKAKRAMIATTSKLVDEATSIWIFPEGTRNKGGSTLPFKQGAFRMAVEAGVPIVPVCVSSYRRSMDLSKSKSCSIAIKALAPIPTMGMSARDIPFLIDSVHAMMIQGIQALDAELAEA